jgi:type IV secretory pathway TrbF-like protein
MAGAMEFGKLVTVAVLSHWCALLGWWRGILSVLTVILVLINATGVYGKLSTAHLDPYVVAVAAVAAKKAASDAKIAAQEDVITNLERQIAQIDNAVDEANKRGRATSAMTIANDQHKARENLVNQNQPPRRRQSNSKSHKRTLPGSNSARPPISAY